MRPKGIDFLFFYSIIYLIEGVCGLLAYLERKKVLNLTSFLRIVLKKIDFPPKKVETNVFNELFIFSNFLLDLKLIYGD